MRHPKLTGSGKISVPERVAASHYGEACSRYTRAMKQVEQSESEITQLLASAREGGTEQIEKLFELLYSELRQLASSRLGGGNQTLTPTVLVHEAFLRLTTSEDLTLNDRRHFFACAARSMRCIVIDHARRASATRHGGDLARVTLNQALLANAGPRADADLLSLDQALDRLDHVNSRQREVVELHYFAGLTFAEIAALHECTERTALRQWERARAFLHLQLAAD